MLVKLNNYLHSLSFACALSTVTDASPRACLLRAHSQTSLAPCLLCSHSQPSRAPCLQPVYCAHPLARHVRPVSSLEGNGFEFWPWCTIPTVRSSSPNSAGCLNTSNSPPRSKSHGQNICSLFAVSIEDCMGRHKLTQHYLQFLNPLG